MKNKILALLITAACTTLAACHVPPKPNMPELTTNSPLGGIPSSNADWPHRDWWARYHNDDLNAIESLALSKSPDLAVAQARFNEASRAIDVARANAGATIEGNVQVQRERLSENGLFPPKFLGFTWYNLGDVGVQFKYDFDFWGSHRAEIAASMNRTRAASAERETAATMLTAALADSYFNWQLDMAHIGFANESMALEEKIRSIAAARVKHGLDPEDILQQADAEIAAMREDIATFTWAAQMRRAAIAALTGISPSEVPEFHVRPLPAFVGALPENAGLDLVARRPDVQASRWRVEAASRAPRFIPI
jgi:multidrug efflux system outer membrane protein